MCDVTMLFLLFFNLYIHVDVMVRLVGVLVEYKTHKMVDAHIRGWKLYQIQFANYCVSA